MGGGYQEGWGGVKGEGRGIGKDIGMPGRGKGEGRRGWGESKGREGKGKGGDRAGVRGRCRARGEGGQG